MRFLKNRRLHVNMGNYEHLETTATVDVDTNLDADALRAEGIDPSDLDAVKDFVDDQIDAFMEPDIRMAAVYTDEAESFVLPYEKDLTTNQKRK